MTLSTGASYELKGILSDLNPLSDEEIRMRESVLKVLNTTTERAEQKLEPQWGLSDMMGISSAADTLAATVRDSTTTVVEAADGLGERLENTFANINVSHNINFGIMDRFKDFFPFLLNILTEVGKYGGDLISSFMEILSSSFSLPTAIVDGVKSLFEWFSGATVDEPTEPIEPQVDDKGTESLYPRVKRLFSVMAEWLPWLFGESFGRLFKSTYLHECSEFICDAFADFKFVLKSLYGVVTFIKHMLAFFAKMLGYPEVARSLTSNPLLYESTEFLEEVHNRLSDGSSIPTIHDAEKVRDYSKKLMRGMQNIGAKHADYGTYRLLLTKMDKLSHITEKLYTTATSRVPPTTTCLYGRAGIGKSYILDHMTQSAVIDALPYAELTKYATLDPTQRPGVFYLNCNAKHFDGLCCTDNVLVIEEFLAIKDTGTDPGAAVTAFTQIVNEAHFEPPMAAVEEKGKTPFHMKYVLMTTNVARWGPDVLKSIACPDAIHRRIHFGYEVTLGLEYCDEEGRIDPLLLNQEFYGDSVYPQRMVPMNFKTGLPTGDPVTVEQAIEIMKQHRRDHQAIYDRKHARLHAERNRLIEERLAEGPPVVIPQMDDDDDDDYTDPDGGSVAPQGYYDFYDRWDARVLTKVNHLTKGYDWDLSDVWKAVKSSAPVALAIAAVTGVVSIAWAVLRGSAVSTQSVDTEVKKRKVLTRKAKESRIRRARQRGNWPIEDRGRIEDQGLSNEDDINIMNVVLKNLCEVHIGHLSDKSVQSTRPKGFALFIGGYTAVMPAHFEATMSSLYEEWLCSSDGVPSMDKQLYVEFRFPGRSGGNPVCPLGSLLEWFTRCSTVEGLDKIYVTLPTHAMKPRKNIVRHFIDSSEGGESWLIKLGFDGEVNLRHTRSKVSCASYSNSQGESYRMPTALCYAVNTTVGDCGSVLFARHENGALGIAGIHVAGYSGDRSGAYAVTFGDELDDLVRSVAGDCPNIVLPSHLKLRKAKEPTVPVNHEVLSGTLGRPMAGSSLIPDVALYSELCGTKPASVLVRYKDGECLDPMAMSQDKYSRNCVVVDPDALTVAKATVVRRMQERNVRKSYQTMSFHEAMTGFGNVGMLNRSSFCGLEESILFGTCDKVAFMGIEGPVDPDAPMYARLKTHVEDTIKRVLSGEYVPSVFDSIPKDECLPNAKVDAGKVRMISASSLTMGIITRMFYGQVQDTLVDDANKIRNGRGLGTNPYGKDWSTLAHKMLSDLPSGPSAGVLEYDFKGYDGSLSPQYMNAAFDVLDAFIPTNDPTAITMRTWIRNNTCFSISRVGSEIVQMTGSNPSGNFLTTILNDTVQDIAILLSTSRHVATNHRSLVNMEPYRPASEFVDSEEIYEAQFNVYDYEQSYQISLLYELVTYGDDGLMSVSLLLQYDTRSLAIATKSHGFALTNGDKTDPYIFPQPPKPLTECSFLKRGFRLDGTVWRAPLTLASIYQSMGWKRKGSSDEDRSQVFPNAMLEFALHGKEVYDYESTRAFDEFMMEGRNPVAMNYDQAIARVSEADVSMY
jgi:hypothetical protein